MSCAFENPMLHILIVEDEMLVSMVAEDMLSDLGHRSTVAAGVREAQAVLATETIDAAIVDVNLNGETSEQLARQICDSNIPMAFATGYGTVPFEGFATVPILSKPYTIDVLREMIEQITRKAA